MDDKEVVRPAALEPLSDDYHLIEMALDALSSELEFAARADLAEELIKACATSEDAKEHALYPFLIKTGNAHVAEQMRDSARHVGKAMIPIFKVTHHSVPIDAHKADPEGFERDLERFVALLNDHLDTEQTELYPTLFRFTGEQAWTISRALHLARRHALEHPLPPHNPLARWLTKIEERVDHFADTSEQYRPGRKRIAS